MCVSCLSTGFRAVNKVTKNLGTHYSQEKKKKKRKSFSYADGFENISPFLWGKYKQKRHIYF